MQASQALQPAAHQTQVRSMSSPSKALHLLPRSLIIIISANPINSYLGTYRKPLQPAGLLHPSLSYKGLSKFTSCAGFGLVWSTTSAPAGT
jgi:hypothetical protein